MSHKHRTICYSPKFVHIAEPTDTICMRNLLLNQSCIIRGYFDFVAHLRTRPVLSSITTNVQQSFYEAYAQIWIGKKLELFLFFSEMNLNTSFSQLLFGIIHRQNMTHSMQNVQVLIPVRCGLSLWGMKTGRKIVIR